MIIVNGVSDKKAQILIKRYCNFVFSKFLTRSVIKKARVVVEIIDRDTLSPSDKKEMKLCAAWMKNLGMINNKRHFVITVDQTSINKTAKKLTTQYKNVLKDIGHELVHVKQYLTNDLFDYKDGRVRYKKKIFEETDNTELTEAYWFSPWEVEAYGYMEGLYQLFIADQKKKKS